MPDSAPQAPYAHRISMRALAEALLMSGDLSPGDSAAAMRIGALAHKAAQAQGKQQPGYRAEVPVRITYEAHGIALEITGRVDALIIPEDDDACPTIEEYKTVSEAPEDGLPVHWAQAEGYAHMLCAERGLDAVCVSLCYLAPDGSQRTRMTRRLDAATLQARFTALADAYIAELNARLAREAVRNASLSALNFPYDEGFRPGQRAMAGMAYRALRDGTSAFIEAPTGTGKTAAALFPAAKALGEGHFDKLLYCTSRTTGREAAAAMLHRMLQHGAHLRGLALTARDKLCTHPPCDAFTCPLLIGHYDRLRGALACHAPSGHMAAGDVLALAEAHALCPFELQLELASRCDIVIGDVNYAFDPLVRLRRFFDDRHALLIDEAHALIDRAREMFSAELSLKPLKCLRTAVGKALGRKHEAWKLLGPPVKALEALKAGEGQRTLSTQEGFVLAAMPEGFDEALSQANQSLFAFDAGGDAQLSETLGALWWFCRVAEQRDADYALLLIPHEGLTLRQYLTHPGSRVREVTRKAQGAVFFSATLWPMPFTADLLGGVTEEGAAPCAALPSPFPPENLLVLRAPVSTRYAHRAETLARVAALTAAACHLPGRYLVFFPSYAYLRALEPVLRQLLPEADVLVQNPDMPEDARAAFLAAFAPERPAAPMLGLAVLGGAFGESVDLPGNRLNGAVIIGVALPQIGLERECLRAAFDARGEQGFLYAYAHPGMTRVMQASGRVIRTAQDRGVVLLIDDRFGRPAHDHPALRMQTVRDEADVRRRIAAFYGLNNGGG